MRSRLRSVKPASRATVTTCMVLMGGTRASDSVQLGLVHGFGAEADACESGLTQVRQTVPRDGFRMGLDGDLAILRQAERLLWPPTGSWRVGRRERVVGVPPPK